MDTDSEIINILCYKLPYDVSRVIYNEYKSRKSEVYRILDYDTDKYKFLKRNDKAVLLILAMSVFYRRIMCNFGEASVFYNRVSKDFNSDKSKCVVSIGAFKFNDKESRRLQSVVRQFRDLMQKYELHFELFMYDNTYGFVKEVKAYYDSFDLNINTNNEPF